MAENPYVAGVEVGAGERTSRPLRGRPIGISILAGLSLLGGLALLAVTAVMLLVPEASDALHEMGVYPPLLIVGTFLLAALSLGTAVGMWQGHRWGWWLGAFTQVYNVAREAATLLTMTGMVEDFSDEPVEPRTMFVRFAVRSVIGVLLIAYFFKENVLEYFRLENLNRLTALVGLVVVCLLIVAAFNGLNWLATDGM